MGLFNFLRSKKNPAEIDNEYNLRKHICDVEKLQVIIDLGKTPKNERDATWQSTFLENIDSAGFSESIPQVKIGPDNFPYFILKTGEKFNPFESYCIRKIKDDILLVRGMGVVINPGPGDESDWVFTYGDILNFHLNFEFYSKVGPVQNSGMDVIHEDTEVMISEPSESYLPDKAKKVIKTNLIKAGISKPKMLMMNRLINGEIVQELVFNIFREDFSSEEEFKQELHRLHWYLPRHYIITTITKKSAVARQLKVL
jgi:hypothetical protein